MNKRLPEYKKVFSLDLFKEYKKEFKPNYILMIIMSILYVGILYKYGIQNTFIQNLDLIKYLILAPMLLSVIIIDYKYQIIPNRLNLTMFEIGLVFAFLYGFSNVAISINMFVGMLVRRRNFFSNNFFTIPFAWSAWGRQTSETLRTHRHNFEFPFKLCNTFTVVVAAAVFAVFTKQTGTYNNCFQKVTSLLFKGTRSFCRECL